MSSRGFLLLVRSIFFCCGFYSIFFHLQISHEIEAYSTTDTSRSLQVDPLPTSATACNTQSTDNDSSIYPSQETAVIISTHLVPSHPSLDLLQQVIQGYRENLIGLPKDAPLIITVDGIKTEGQNARIDMVETTESKKIYHEYLQNLHKEFGLVENVRIVVTGMNIGLSKMLKQVIDAYINVNITKYMYLLQHDLKFTRPVNHTAIIELAKAFPDHVNIVNFKRNKRFCKNITNGDIIEKGSGIQFRKTTRWSDQNQFARISHFVKDVLPEVASDNGASMPFPEMRMMRLAEQNCEKYGVYEYNAGFHGMYQHLDGSERLGENLAKRIREGEIQFSTLNDYTKAHLKKMGVNVTQLLEEVRAKGLQM
ncbi:hypothetical protein CTEN210_16014 [Chaetoceros tenuissimus]|uniref:Uncharacterized protein n=1 Tax=Chaetoceros tenuissimus TaxID=426638 RepID=A0AAD3HDZ7_9STRA|nr:hypothetical protein CTEN210_16014 [Chaetoceros tenuissimus]